MSLRYHRAIVTWGPHKTRGAAAIQLGLLFVAALAQATEGVPTDPDLVPAWLIELPKSVENVLIADTGSATMRRFSRQGQVITWTDDRYMSIGKKGIRKQRAWDKKTPLGTYFVTERLNTTHMHARYGVAAFPLDYPNDWDRYNKRTGYGIWLHGVDRNNPDRPPLDTGGCLALPNEALLQIVDHLIPLVTPVIVVQQMEWVQVAVIETIRAEFRLVLEQWQQSLMDGDLLTYLSLYGDDFRHGDMDKNEWSAFRLQVFAARRIQQYEIRDLLLLGDPGDPDLYLSRFTQLVATDKGTITTTKRLYWRRSPKQQWKIVSEGSG